MSTYRLLRTAQTAQGGSKRFNITVSCEMAALNWLLHCFFESSQGYVKMLGILNKKLDFWKNFGLGTNIALRNHKILSQKYVGLY